MSTGWQTDPPCRVLKHLKTAKHLGKDREASRSGEQERTQQICFSLEQRGTLSAADGALSVHVVRAKASPTQLFKEQLSKWLMTILNNDSFGSGDEYGSKCLGPNCRVRCIKGTEPLGNKTLSSPFISK